MLAVTPPTDGEIEISAAIDAARISTLQWLVFALCLSVSVLDGFDLQTLAFAAPSIRDELGIAPDALGLVFSGTLLGAVFGSYFGVLADRYGRKIPITVAVGLFGACTFACAFASGFADLFVLRLIAGIGLGGAVPNMIALTAEFAPKRVRSLAVTVVLWGFPIGAIVGGLLSSSLIGAHGWRAVFFLGAAGPLLLLPLLIFALPESPRYLALTARAPVRLGRILARIRPDLPVTATTRFRIAEPAATRGRLRTLFRSDLAPASLLLAIAGFFSLLLSYLMGSWTPSLLHDAGLSVESAIFGAVILNLGALVGSYVLSRVVDGRAGGLAYVAATFLAGAIVLFVMSRLQGALAATIVALGAFGFCHMGAQIAITTYVSNFFPTFVRGTAIAWVGAVSRLGSLVGPALGGYLLALGVGRAQLFALGAFPALVTAAALAALAVLLRRRGS
jgi:AAHS family 4-hydroxybenzoate transporter-like MFS transporter